MGKSEKPKGMKRVAVAAAMGAAVTVIASMCLILPWAALLTSGKIGEEALVPGIVTSAFLGTLVGAFTARRWGREAALLTCLMTALITIVARLIVAMISERSGGIDSLDLAVSAAILIAAATVGAVRKGKRRIRR